MYVMDIRFMLDVIKLKSNPLNILCITYKKSLKISRV